MNNFFNLSNGILKDLISPNSLFTRSCICTNFSSGKRIFKITSQRPILHVSDVTFYYDSANKEVKCFCGLKINDGTYEYLSMINKEKWYLTENNQFDINTQYLKVFLNYNNKRNCLEKGSIIMLSEYSLNDTDRFLSEHFIQKDPGIIYPEYILVFDEFDIIGSWKVDQYSELADFINETSRSFSKLSVQISNSTKI